VTDTSVFYVCVCVISQLTNWQTGWICLHVSSFVGWWNCVIHV